MPVDDAPMMAIVIGITTAVNAELSKCLETPPVDEMTGLVQQLPAPSPALTPEQVLGIQLAALKMNDVPEPNNGVRVAWDFCTPESQDYVGGRAHFEDLYRDVMYLPLVNFREVQFSPMTQNAHRASQRFTVVPRQGKAQHYVAHLVCQQAGDRNGCWLVDAILPVSGQ